MNYKLKIITIFIVVILPAAAVLFVFNLKKESANEIGSEEVKLREKAITELDPDKMSRITLFNSDQDRISLAIPEWWEGKYRLKEAGSEAIFSYIDKEGASTGLFTIKKYVPDDWGVTSRENRPAEEAVLQKSDYVYTYFLSTVKQADDVSDKEYGQMLSEVELVIKTLK